MSFEGRLLDGLQAVRLLAVRGFVHFIPTNPTGHYKLDLINPMHRIIKERMVGIAKEEKDFRKANVANEGGTIIDTSQHGDWENFRNETLNKEKYDFDTEEAAAGGVEEGILEFDYVSTDVAHRMGVRWHIPFRCLRPRVN